MPWLGPTLWGPAACHQDPLAPGSSLDVPWGLGPQVFTDGILQEQGQLLTVLLHRERKFLI